MEVASLVLGVAGLLPVLIQGRRLVAHYRRSRRWRLQASGSTPLVTEIDHSRTEINNRFSDFHRAYGEAFARGDETARNQLNRLVIMLQHELIEVLMASRIGGRLNSIPLINVTSTSRVDAIDAMATLAQRVATTRSITSGPSSTPVWPRVSVESLPRHNNAIEEAKPASQGIQKAQCPECGEHCMREPPYYEASYKEMVCGECGYYVEYGETLGSTSRDAMRKVRCPECGEHCMREPPYYEASYKEMVCGECGYYVEYGETLGSTSRDAMRKVQCPECGERRMREPSCDEASYKRMVCMECNYYEEI